MNQYSSAAAPLAGRNGEEEETRPLASGVLSGCGSFCISKLFSRDDYAIASQVVRKSGGTLAPPASARYLLAPLEGAWSGQKGVESQLEEVDGIAVTMIWLVSFLKCFANIFDATMDPCSNDASMKAGY